MDGEDLAVDWSEGYETGAVAITELGESCAEGTQEEVDKAIAAIKDGSLQVFDASKWTVDGKNLTTYTFDSTIIDFSTGNVVYEGQKYEAIVDGAFVESNFRSAPYFDVRIDGITELN